MNRNVSSAPFDLITGKGQLQANIASSSIQSSITLKNESDIDNVKHQNVTSKANLAGAASTTASSSLAIKVKDEMGIKSEKKDDDELLSSQSTSKLLIGCDYKTYHNKRLNYHAYFITLDSSDMSGLNAIISAAGVDPSMLENSPDNNHGTMSMSNPPSTTKRSTISHPKKNRLSTDALHQAEVGLSNLSAPSPAKTSLNTVLQVTSTPSKLDVSCSKVFT